MNPGLDIGVIADYNVISSVVATNRLGLNLSSLSLDSDIRVVTLFFRISDFNISVSGLRVGYQLLEPLILLTQRAQVFGFVSAPPLQTAPSGLIRGISEESGGR